MPFILYIDHGVEKHFDIPTDRMVVFGREDHCDFQIINDSRVSREHFAIEREDNGFFHLIDLGARNGTFLNGQRVGANAVIPLKDGDVITAGRERFTFLLERRQRQKTCEIVRQVAESLDSGKGYKTVLGEIVGGTFGC